MSLHSPGCATPQKTVSAGKVTAAYGGCERQLSGQAQAAADLGEGPGAVGTRETHDIEAGALARQPGPAADRPDNEVRQRHRGIKVSFRGDIKTAHADCRFRDAGDVLAAGDDGRSTALGRLF